MTVLSITLSRCALYQLRGLDSSSFLDQQIPATQHQLMQTAAATITPSTREQAAQPHLLEQRGQHRLEAAGTEGTAAFSAPQVISLIPVTFTHHCIVC